jgi:aryl-alcohol dehydrogenase-like predicted oxidoreductase
MKYQPLGNSGLNASVIGLGAWVLGGGRVWGRDTDDQESIRAIQAALDLGINLVDTAPAYGWGRSEEIVGRAIKGRRDQVIVATKCGLWTDDDRGSYFTELDGKTMRRSLRPDTIAIEIERSLRRLGVDCIDLYQTHWPSVPPDFTPIADTMACLLKLKDQGKIRAIGVCNATLPELQSYLKEGAVISHQFRYSMLHRRPEEEILPFCRESGLAALPYMSLEQGLLTGKVGMDRVFSKEEFRSNAAWNPWYLLQNRRRVLDLLAGWRPITGQYQCTPAQLVLAWTLAQPGITHVLAGCRNVAQATENAQAGGLELSEETLQRMRRDVEGLGEPA